MRIAEFGLRIGERRGFVFVMGRDFWRGKWIFGVGMGLDGFVLGFVLAQRRDGGLGIERRAKTAKGTKVAKEMQVGSGFWRGGRGFDSVDFVSWGSVALIGNLGRDRERAKTQSRLRREDGKRDEPKVGPDKYWWGKEIGAKMGSLASF